MLELLDLNQKVDKASYKREKDALELRLAELQREARQRQIPVLILFEGWDAAGKGTLINELILPLDPRGFKVQSTLRPTEEEALRPFLWRFWIRIPDKGRIAVFDRSWYSRLLEEAAGSERKGGALKQAFRDVTSFERQLTDEGAVILKFFLHISKAEQKKRFDKLLKNEATAWRVTKEDLRRHKAYGRHALAVEAMLAASDTSFAPWTVVEAHDRRFAVLKLYRTVIERLERRIARPPDAATGKAAPMAAEPRARGVIARLDLSQSLDRGRYEKQLKSRQKRLRELEHVLYRTRTPMAIVYEGCDAAGKGGSIRRLTANLDPRGYEVVPVSAPNDVEKRHPYLWRFWTRLPKAGHITIFDRSWYGRVLVKRVEGFCTEEEWRRAYREINEMEQHLADFGMILVKFWLQIDKDEQLRRFRERESETHKRWKITEEDWRNRRKWKASEAAVEEMLLRTSTPHAPWTIVESNCKLFARIKALDTVIAAVERHPAVAAAL